MCISRIFHELNSIKAIQTVLFSILFGMLLPSGDAGTDIRLGVDLYINGQPKWAFAVLSPVFLNTIFTIMACRQMEKQNNGVSWIAYLPLVFLQVYPQFCVGRLLAKYFANKIDLEEFISSQNGMDGGLGCVEPYCESVPQMFIQTAIFAHVHNLTPMLTRLCFTELDESCNRYPECDDMYDCGKDPYATGYERYTRIMSVGFSKENCTLQFEECIKPFKNCIEECKVNITAKIMALDERILYSMMNNSTAYPDNQLLQGFNTTMDDIKDIQMYRLVIGNYELFTSTYVLSIIAAAYGISKFFRLGHARIIHNTVELVSTSVVNMVFLILKVIVLSSLVLGKRESLTKSSLWFFLITMLPTTLLVLVFTIIVPSIRMYQRVGKFQLGYIGNMILKQPCIILAPHVSPFFFTLGEIYVIEKPVIVTADENYVVPLDCFGTYSVSQFLTCVNSIVSFTFMIILICMKGYWITDGWKVVTCVTTAFIIIAAGFVFIMMTHGHIETSSDCIEHYEVQCMKCIRKYGFYVERFKLVEVCVLHTNKKPREYVIPTKDCKICGCITMR